MNTLHWIEIFAVTAVALIAAGHALLHKRDSRSALGWVAICLTFPLAGALLYLLFGVNRVQRRASRIRQKIEALPSAQALPAEAHVGHAIIPPHSLSKPLQTLERIGRNVLDQELIGGNCVEPLFNGQEAYPAMLKAMESARQSIYLITYIFDTDNLGTEFIDTLARAVSRGVDVRVIVDGAGEKYSWPWASTLLHKKNVPTALFLPPHLFPPEVRINMRNHRKILVVDGAIGFTGGMNLSRRHFTDKGSSRAISDVHFMLSGPIVSQLQDAFVEGWHFATQERLDPPIATTEPAGDALCRTVEDGPDQDGDNLAALLAGVISAATTSIRIMTPYFLPPREILSALRAARYRDVDVQILLPARNNLPFVHWANRHLLPDLLRTGVRVAYQSPPFCHTKLLLVDGVYTHLGSANMDCRSLRLNFELTVEVLDASLGARMERHFDEIMAKSRVVTLDELQHRALPTRMRDAFFWLFTPYL